MRLFVKATTVLALAFFAVGTASSGANAARGFHRDVNLFYTVKFAATILNFNESIPVAINDQGQMTGYGVNLCRGLHHPRRLGQAACGPPDFHLGNGAGPNFISGGHCLLFDGNVLTDFTPSGVSDCIPVSLNEFAYVVGAVAPSDENRNRGFGPNIFLQAFLYESPTQTFNTEPVELFTQINNLGKVSGGVNPGLIFDLGSNGITNMYDPKTGCEMQEALGINGRNHVFGEDVCNEGTRYEIVTNNGNTWRYLSVPGGYTVDPNIPANYSDDLLLTNSTTRHTYLWRGAQGGTTDLGYLTGHSGDTYVPIAFNDNETILGEDTTFGIFWVWDPVHGMRDLSSLIQANSYSGITPNSINSKGDLGSFGFDSSDNLTWLVLVHPHI